MITLSDLNIIGSKIIYNSKPEDLYEITLSKKMGFLTNDRVLSVNTGKFTGRSPKDRYIVKDETKSNIKSTDINVLLNRVRLDQKKESRKKLLFTAATSIGVILFGALIF